MFEPGAFEAGGEGGPEWPVIPPRQLTAQESGHIVGFDGMNGRPTYDLGEIMECRVVGKENVRRIFHLHETPVVLALESFEDRAILGDEVVQRPMQGGAFPRIGELLGPGEIGQGRERIIRQLEGNALVR